MYPVPYFSKFKKRAKARLMTLHISFLRFDEKNESNQFLGININDHRGIINFTPRAASRFLASVLERAAINNGR